MQAFLEPGVLVRHPGQPDWGDGQVQYARLAARPEFARGLARLLERAPRERLALMCAEKEPLACHRTLLVARELAAKAVPVEHIHADGHLEPHADAVRRLRALVGVPELDLIKTQTQLDDEAYALQARRIAYVLPPALAPPDPGA